MKTIQLNQKCLPVFCNEGVYQRVTQITLQNLAQFENHVGLLGGFYKTKAAEYYNGELVKGSEFDDVLVKSKAFGVKL